MVNTPWKALGSWAERTPNAMFLTQPFDGQLLEWTRRLAYDDVTRLAQGFLDIGLRRGDKVALLSKNCAEWILTDIALSLAGLV